LAVCAFGFDSGFAVAARPFIASQYQTIMARGGSDPHGAARTTARPQHRRREDTAAQMGCPTTTVFYKQHTSPDYREQKRAKVIYILIREAGLSPPVPNPVGTSPQMGPQMGRCLPHNDHSSPHPQGHPRKAPIEERRIEKKDCLL